MSLVKKDPQRARKWFALAVETLETAPADKTEAACQRLAAGVLLGIISGRDRALADRLIPIIETSKNVKSENERLENAHVLIQAESDLSIVIRALLRSSVRTR